MSMGGAVGGLLCFALMEPTLRAAEQQASAGRVNVLDLDAIAAAIQHIALLGVVLGAAIGVSLIVADEIGSRRPLRLVWLCALGVIVGGLCGMVGAFVGQAGFSIFLALHLLIVGRAIGWSLMGAAAGLCMGTVTRSPRRAIQGVIGGLVGGGLGGLVFDAIGQTSETGGASRFVGFVVMGGMIGFAVGLVEEWGKQFWLTVLTGAKEGRSFILTRSNTIVGRDELADIPLFGDVGVGRQHAIVSLTPLGVFVAAAPGQSITVNNQPVAQATLADGDIIGVGGHRLRFGARRAPLNAPVMAAAMGMEGRQAPGMPADPGWLPGASLPTVPYAANPDVTSAFALPGEPAAPLSHLQVTEGPNQGQTFALADGAIIGRDPRCDIALTRDAQASRQHARLILLTKTDNLGNTTLQWIIEDGGSTNGTWVNGVSVTGEILRAGDEIRVGNSTLRVQ
jgi:pSer/pThr/pTyr-binding forkhead associated (FHA) protein